MTRGEGDGCNDEAVAPEAVAPEAVASNKPELDGLATAAGTDDNQESSEIYWNLKLLAPFLISIRAGSFAVHAGVVSARGSGP